MCMQCRSDTGHCRNAYSYTKTNMRRNVRKSPDHRCSEHTEWSWHGGQVECIKKEWQYTLDVYIKFYVELIDLCYF